MKDETNDAIRPATRAAEALTSITTPRDVLLPLNGFLADLR
ncbi:MAG TPA: hypothetical protein VEB88_03660 [Candidatus Acidoferrales bacterium]|nr:hypothetical protein [Candidatus Acidoferrales bacterium]